MSTIPEKLGELFVPNSLPRFVVAAPRSGEGKTTVALGLMAAFARRNLQVQGFKVGPDYLDTSFQQLATGRPGRNLDVWLMGEAAVQNSVYSQAPRANIAIIEGVMGLFDGHRDGTTPTSTADVAKLVNAPVVLVMDASRMAASAGALALGFKSFDKNLRIAGVILNRWSPGRSLAAVANALEKAGVALLGTLAKAPDCELPSRHLGLIGAQEQRAHVISVLNNLATQMEASVDLNSIFDAANSAPFVPEIVQAFQSPQFNVRLGLARDNAFSFYYPENLEMLEQCGVKIVPFSPCSDARIPENLDGLYIGGGYPEEHAQLLATNTSMLQSVRDAVGTGMPIYAECGGMLYLSRTLTTLDKREWPFAAVVPANVFMQDNLYGMGYRTGKMQNHSPVGIPGDLVKGHEFHYSKTVFDSTNTSAYCTEIGNEGFSSDNIFCSYLHVHFAGNPKFCENFVQSMHQFKNKSSTKEINK